MFIGIEILATMVLVPWETLPCEMTTDFDRRSYLTNWRFIWAGIAYTLANFIPGQMFKFLGEDNPNVFLYNALIFTGIFAIAFFISYVSTWERSDVDITYKAEMESSSHSGSSFSLKSLKGVISESLSTLRIRVFRQHLTMYICSFTALDLFGGIFVFWAVYALHLNKSLIADGIALGGLISMPVGLFSAWLLIKLGIRKLLNICYGTVLGCIIVITALFGFKDSVDVTTIVFITTVVFVIFKGPLYFVPWNIYGFIPDVDEMVTKQRREGSFAGVMVLIRKVTLSLAMFILGILLDIGGLDKNATVQSAGAIHMMEGILIIGVVGMLIAAVYAASRMNLNKETHAILVKEVHRLRNGGNMKDVPDGTRLVVEDLTGFAYEKTWGHNNVVEQPEVINSKPAQAAESL
jgi:oligogalacturonide transporter